MASSHKWIPAGTAPKTTATSPSPECDGPPREGPRKTDYIHYPTDLRLLGEAREWLERCIDVMHRPDIGVKGKPRTYRQEARWDYLNNSKSKKTTYKQLRKAIRKQLQYLRRDLTIIAGYGAQGRFSLLSDLELERLETCRMVYGQQKEFYETEKSPKGRIVSLHMPFVRPIKRGKAGAETEFGPKVAVSVVEGAVFVERISFEDFNEGITLIQSAQRYRQRFGYYPTLHCKRYPGHRRHLCAHIPGGGYQVRIRKKRRVLCPALPAQRRVCMDNGRGGCCTV